LQVQLREELGTMQLINEIVYKRNGKYVLDDLLIKLSIIDAESPYVVLLFYKLCKGTNIVLYYSIGKHFLH
jgi:hypothetical protein